MSPSVDEFRGFFDEHLAYVCEALRRLGVPSRDIEDVAHELFLIVHQRFGEYDRSRPARPWLLAFAHRVASGYRQRAAHRLEIFGDDGAEALRSESPSPLDLATVADERALVHAALDTLGAEQRVVFVFHQLEERPMAEIASELGIPVATAYSRLRLAREAFASAVKRLSARQAFVSGVSP